MGCLEKRPHYKAPSVRVNTEGYFVGHLVAVALKQATRGLSQAHDAIIVYVARHQGLT